MREVRPCADAGQRWRYPLPAVQESPKTVQEEASGAVPGQRGGYLAVVAILPKAISAVHRRIAALDSIRQHML